MDLVRGVTRGPRYAKLSTRDEDDILPHHQETHRQGTFIAWCSDIADQIDAPDNKHLSNVIGATAKVILLWAGVYYWMFPELRFNIACLIVGSVVLMMMWARSISNYRIAERTFRRR